MLSNLPSKQIIVLVILWCTVHSKTWESGLRERYDGYGEDWIFMPDGNGRPQVAVLKFPDNEARGVLDSSDIAYIIYTRYFFIFIQFVRRVDIFINLSYAIPF